MKQFQHHILMGALAATLTSGCLLSARARPLPLDYSYSTPSEVYVSAPMPAPRVEVVQVQAPSEGMAWVDGYWQWGGGTYVWAPGRWARPSHPGYVWSAPRYESRSDRHVYIRGQWAPRNVVVRGSVGRGRGEREERGHDRAPPARRGRRD